MGASPGAWLGPLSLGVAEKTPHLPLRHHTHGVPGWGLQQGRKAETQLCKSTPTLGSWTSPLWFKADTEFPGSRENKEQIEIEAFFFLLVFFLQYQNTVENNFS